MQALRGLSAPAIGAAEDGTGAGLEYAPATAVTLAAGATETVEIRGQGGNPFAFDRLTAAGDTRAITATARVEEGTRTLFKDVHLEALRSLTRLRRLKGVLMIGQRDALQLELTNRSDQEQSASVQLLGYGSAVAIEEQRACLKSTYGYEPKVELLSGYAELSAGASGVRIDVRRSFPVRFRRFFVESDRPEDVRAALKLYSDTVMQEVRLQQITDRYLKFEAPSPMILDGNTPLSVELRNTGAAAAAVSVLFEAYREETAAE